MHPECRCACQSENCLTLVNEKHVALLQDAESQPVANVPAGTDEASALIRTLRHALYALLATLTTGRSLRLVQRVPNRNGTWQRTHRRQRVEDSRCCKPCCSREWVTIRQSSRKERQVDVYEKLATSMLNDDVKISVVLREAPSKLRRQTAGELSAVREELQQVASDSPSVPELA